MLLFQIDEGKMTERSLKKQIEQMETDIYLVNIDLLRMKNQLDAYKSKSKKFDSDKNVIKEEKKENDDESSEINLSKDSINSADLKKSKKEKEDKSDESSNDNDDIDDEIIKRKPTKSAARKGIMRVGNIDPSIKARETADNFSNKLTVNFNNMEIVRMKERLDEMNDDLSLKITENEELKQEVFDLKNTINNLNIKIQENEDDIKELHQQIEALDATNEAFEKNIEELSNYKKDMGNEINELIKSKNDEENKIQELIEMRNSLNDLYKKKCRELFNKNKDLIVEKETIRN